MINEVVGKLIADKYRVEKLIRESGSGDLYLGKHEVVDKPVMLKVLPAAFAVDERWVKRFIAEARAASSLTHPNILNMTDFGTDARNVSYAVFEPVEGKALRDLISSEEPLDEKRALGIARQAAAALSASHAKGMVHARLDPSNIFVGDDDVAKIVGFGGDPLHVERDADPHYLAPEQCSAYPAADVRSDVYSLGVILYEMLAGTVPYEGSSVTGVAAKQNTEPPPPLSAFRRDLHPEIEPIVLSAMAVDPDRRYQDMAAFEQDLETLSTRIGLPPQANAAAAAAGAKRNVWQTAVFVAVGIAIFAAALIYATSVRKTDPTTNLQADAGSLPVQPIGPATGAQEESLAKLPAMTEAEIMAAGQGTDMLPGGDGYNAWANGGMPPAGAPLAGSTVPTPLGGQLVPPVGYVPPAGQTISGETNSGSQFMPPDSSVVEIVNYTIDPNTGQCIRIPSGEPFPCPGGKPATKPAPTPKAPAANIPVPQPTPETAATPKPLLDPKSAKPKATPEKGKAAPSKTARPQDEQEQASAGR